MVEIDDELVDLVDQVIEQIIIDVQEENFEALAEMLTYLPKDVLKYYLPEEKQ